MVPRLYRPRMESVAAEVMEGDAIIINVATGTYYNTEGVGGWIWERCAESKDTAEILAAASARYDAPEEQIAADMQAFFDQLKTEELVTESESSSGAVASVITTAERLPYRTPKLVPYRDLKDLLALDPPMPRLVTNSGASAGTPAGGAPQDAPANRDA